MQFYGQFEIPVDRFIFQRYFPDQSTRGVFVECGAFDGLLECSCKFFEEIMGWHGYNLEPVPWTFNDLVRNRPNSRNLNFGLSERSGQSSFEAVLHPTLGRAVGLGSVKHPPATHEDLCTRGCTFETINVDLLTWSDFIKLEAITEVDLFVLDVEGHELSVISGMMGSPVLPHIMCIEFGHIGFDNLRIAMIELGYEYDTHSFANAYFIRRDKLPLFSFRLATADRKSAYETAAAIESESRNLRQRGQELEKELQLLREQYRKSEHRSELLQQRGQELEKELRLLSEQHKNAECREQELAARLAASTESKAIELLRRTFRRR